MQPLQYYLQDPAAKDNSITHAAAAPSNLDATTTMRSADTELQNTKELRTQEQPLVAEHRGGTHYARNDRSRNRRTHEVPFIAGCGHSTRKNTRFHARLPPQNKAHATFMQPWQYGSQHHVANLHLSTHMATPDDNNHAATPMDLQPQSQETHRTT